MNHRLISLIGSLALGATSIAQAQGTRMLRHPTVSKDLVAFAYAGDLWTVPRSGGQARRLTATPTVETEPHFSPDGSKIAYTATVGGNTDVYVMPAAGGEPTRLTYHPGADRVRGWTPDGKKVVFASARVSPPHNSYFRLFTIGFDALALYSYYNFRSRSNPNRRENTPKHGHTINHCRTGSRKRSP